MKNLYLSLLFFLVTAIQLNFAEQHRQLAHVEHGNVSINSDATTITSTSDLSLVDWNTFSIMQGETVEVTLNSSSSLIVNRVLSSAPSEIHGNLFSNGSVVLVNPSGILIGSEGRIDTAQFVGSTLDISQDDFLEGHLKFKEGGTNGLIQNLGEITCESDISLFSGELENLGKLHSTNGSIFLAASHILKNTGNCSLKNTQSLVLASPHELLVKPTTHNSIYLKVNSEEIIKQNLDEDSALLMNSFYLSAMNTEDQNQSSELVARVSYEVICNNYNPSSETSRSHRIEIISPDKIDCIESSLAADILYFEGEVISFSNANLTADSLSLNPTLRLKIAKSLFNGSESIKIGNIEESFSTNNLLIKDSKLISKNILLNAKAVKLEDNTTLMASNPFDDAKIVIQSLESTTLSSGTSLNTSQSSDTSFIELSSDGDLLLEESQLTSSNILLNGKNINLESNNTLTAPPTPSNKGRIIIHSLKNTFIESTSYLYANATHYGDGGIIELFSDGKLSFYGYADITGGSTGGDGGSIELSAEQSLYFEQSTIKRKSPLGKPGKLILDPYTNVILTSNNAQDRNNSSQLVLNTNQVVNQLNEGPVIVLAKQSQESEESSIVLEDNSPIYYDSPYSLTLSAENGKTSINSDIMNKGVGAIAFETTTLAINSSNITTKGNISINNGERSSDSLTLNQATLQGKNLDIDSKTIAMYSEPIFPSRLVTDYGNIFIKTDSMRCDYGEIEMAQGGNFVVDGNLDLLSAKVHLGSRESTLSIDGNLTLDANKGDITIDADGALHLTAKNLTLLANQEDIRIHSSDLTVNVDRSLTASGVTSDILVQGDKKLTIYAHDLNLQGQVGFVSPDGPTSIDVTRNIVMKNTHPSLAPFIKGTHMNLVAGRMLSLEGESFLETTQGNLKAAAGTIGFDDSSKAIAQKGDLIFTSHEKDISLNTTSHWIARVGGVKVHAAGSFKVKDHAYINSFGKEGMTILTDLNSIGGGYVLDSEASLNAHDNSIAILATKEVQNDIQGKMNRERFISLEESFNTSQEQYAATPQDVLASTSNGVKIFYRHEGEVHLTDQTVTSAEFDDILTAFIGPFTAENFRDLHPYNEFTKDFIRFRDRFSDDSLEPYEIKRRTFRYRNPPFLFPDTYPITDAKHI